MLGVLLSGSTLKLASDAALARSMSDDIDVDCSSVLNGTSLEVVGGWIFDEILATASGKPTASERLGLGESEWVPWIPGAMY
jgi:altronate hydrolase